MKNAYFFLSALVASLFFVSCSDDDGAEKITYHKTNTYVAAWTDKMPGGGELEGFYLVLGYDDTEECFLSDETYVSFEMYSDSRLVFIDGYKGPDEVPHVIRDGVLHMTRENIYLADGDPWSPNPNPDYDHYRQLPVTAASGEGTYEFALKFYQPGSGRYYITPVYRMKANLLPGSHLIRTETTLVN